MVPNLLKFRNLNSSDPILWTSSWMPVTVCASAKKGGPMDLRSADRLLDELQKVLPVRSYEDVVVMPSARQLLDAVAAAGLELVPADSAAAIYS